MQLALDHGFQRYVQSELACGAPLYRRYFAPDIFARFRAAKRSVDPQSIFNRGWVFPFDSQTKAQA
jgi:hypothetical protein